MPPLHFLYPQQEHPLHKKDKKKMKKHVKVPQPGQKMKLNKKKNGVGRGTNFANPPSEKFAWWTRMQIPFTDRPDKSGQGQTTRHVLSTMVRSEHNKYTLKY